MENAVNDARPIIHLQALFGPRTYCRRRMDDKDPAGVPLTPEGEPVTLYAQIANCAECLKERAHIMPQAV